MLNSKWFSIRVAVLVLLLGATAACANHRTIPERAGAESVTRGICIVGNVGFPCTRGFNPKDDSSYYVIIEDGEATRAPSLNSTPKTRKTRRKSGR